VIPLLGDHQLENAATAVGTLEALTSLGVRIPKEAVVRGLREVEWQGRLQILKRRPMLVVDGAHNADSMRRLVVTTRQYFDYEKCIVVFGTSSDKDISGMVRELQPLAAHIIVTSSTHPRAASISTLVKAFSRAGIGVEESRNVSEALSQALDRAQVTDLILVTGSLFVVAEALDYAAKHLVAEADRQTQSSTE
jgi:dihydrofolate synthase/folylpolyglutamate synthase